jgi:Flp pilus assembly protein TadB
MKICVTLLKMDLKMVCEEGKARRERGGEEKRTKEEAKKREEKRTKEEAKKRRRGEERRRKERRGEERRGEERRGFVLIMNVGAIGYLVTDWGDNGHWQQLPISFFGLVAGAGFSWNVSIL